MDLIVFDLDGTLANTLPAMTETANFACRRLGLPEHPAKAIREMSGGGERSLVEQLVGPHRQDLLEDCLKIYLDHYPQHTRQLTRLYPGVVETLEHIRGKRLAVLSNKLQRLTQHVLEAVDIDRFFTSVQGGCSGYPLKPAPDGLLALINSHGVDPSRTLMVGDKPSDIITGRGAGAWTAAGSYGYGDTDSLRAASPDFFLQRVSELPDILTR